VQVYFSRVPTPVNPQTPITLSRVICKFECTFCFDYQCPSVVHAKNVLSRNIHYKVIDNKVYLSETIDI